MTRRPLSTRHLVPSTHALRNGMRETAKSMTPAINHVQQHERAGPQRKAKAAALLQRRPWRNSEKRWCILPAYPERLPLDAASAPAPFPVIVCVHLAARLMHLDVHPASLRPTSPAQTHTPPPNFAGMCVCGCSMATSNRIGHSRQTPAPASHIAAGPAGLEGHPLPPASTSPSPPACPVPDGRPS